MKYFKEKLDLSIICDPYRSDCRCSYPPANNKSIKTSQSMKVNFLVNIKLLLPNVLKISLKMMAFELLCDYFLKLLEISGVR